LDRGKSTQGVGLERSAVESFSICSAFVLNVFRRAGTFASSVMNSSCGASIVALLTPRFPGGFRAKVDDLMLLDRKQTTS
jgi:hypothetical protein